MEQWRKIPGVDERYEVSDLGRVRSHANGGPWGKKCRQEPMVLKACISTSGYPSVNLPNGPSKWKVFYVHRLVALAFLGPPKPGQEVAHNDGSRTNCAASNLRWATRAENHADKRQHGTSHEGERAPTAKLSNKDAEIIAERLASGEVGASIARAFGVSESSVSRIKLRQSYVAALTGMPLVAALEAAPERKQ